MKLTLLYNTLYLIVINDTKHGNIIFVFFIMNRAYGYQENL